MKIEKRKLSDIRPYPGNPRKNDAAVDAVAESIRQCGYISPIIVDEEGVILAGHTRYKALKKLRRKQADVAIAEGLSEEQKRKFRLLDNKVGEIAEWDEELLRIELGDLDFGQFDFNFPSFELPETVTVQSYERRKATVDIIEDNYDEAPPERPMTQRGDIYMLGRHRLMCGDSTVADDIDTLLNGQFVRLTVTSPPYGVGKDYESKGIEPCLETIQGVINAIKGKTLIIAWNIGDLFATGTQFTEPTCAYSVQMMQEAGYGMLYNRIWKKPGANFAGNNPYYTVTTKPAQDYEYLLAFAELNADRHLSSLKEYLFAQAKLANINNAIVRDLNGPEYMCGHWFSAHQWSFIDEINYSRLAKYCSDNAIPAFKRSYDDLKREYLEYTVYSHCLSDEDFTSWGLYGVWEMNTVHDRLGGHSAAFPVELPSRFIKMHSYEGDLVLDPFGGTGTTLIACEQLDRTCLMMERDPRYCDVIIDRYCQFTGNKAVKL